LSVGLVAGAVAAEHVGVDDDEQIARAPAKRLEQIGGSTT
jgi:hypothetical protein